MPNYEYQCSQCHTRWDDIHPVAARDTPTQQPCPHCGASGVERGWSAAPMAARDSTRKPQKAFRQRMNNMREKLGKYNPTVRNNIDRSLDMGGGQYGTH